MSWGRGRTGWDELGMWDVGWEEGGGVRKHVQQSREDQQEEQDTTISTG